MRKLTEPARSPAFAMKRRQTLIVLAALAIVAIGVFGLVSLRRDVISARYVVDDGDLEGEHVIIDARVYSFPFLRRALGRGTITIVGEEHRIFAVALGLRSHQQASYRLDSRPPGYSSDWAYCYVHINVFKGEARDTISGTYEKGHLKIPFKASMLDH